MSSLRRRALLAASNRRTREAQEQRTRDAAAQAARVSQVEKEVTRAKATIIHVLRTTPPNIYVHLPPLPDAQGYRAHFTLDDLTFYTVSDPYALQLRDSNGVSHEIRSLADLGRLYESGLLASHVRDCTYCQTFGIGKPRIASGCRRHGAHAHGPL